MDYRVGNLYEKKSKRLLEWNGVNEVNEMEWKQAFLTFIFT